MLKVQLVLDRATWAQTALLILYAPALVRHGTGCRKDQGPMNSSGCASPPQFDLYEKAGYLKNGKFVDFPVE